MRAAGHAQNAVPVRQAMLDQLWSNRVGRRITGSCIHGARNVDRMVRDQTLQASLDNDLETLLRLSTQHMTHGLGDARQRSSSEPKESDESSGSTESVQRSVRALN